VQKYNVFIHCFVFSPLFWPTWLHAWDPSFISHLFTLLLHCSHTWTLHGPLNTLYLLCTFLRTKILCTCLYYTLFISSPKLASWSKATRVSPRQTHLLGWALSATCCVSLCATPCHIFTTASLAQWVKTDSFELSVCSRSAVISWRDASRCSHTLLEAVILSSRTWTWPWSMVLWWLGVVFNGHKIPFRSPCCVDRVIAEWVSPPVWWCHGVDGAEVVLASAALSSSSWRDIYSCFTTNYLPSLQDLQKHILIHHSFLL
jgi:hypothetical protein